jgi:hypothetical protein
MEHSNEFCFVTARPETDPLAAQVLKPLDPIF